MLLFRIEDTHNLNRSRSYDDVVAPYTIDKSDVDITIASKIRDEVNGSNKRELLSYSKSLATCILKYNKYTDDELHICEIGGYKDCILYDTNNGRQKLKPYYITERIDGEPLFKHNGKIELTNFIIDISDNYDVDQYLKKYTDVGKKLFASPEKDNEVVLMNPPKELIINQYIEDVYILYALQFKYNFLCNSKIQSDLILDICNLPDYRFVFCPQERDAFISIISYLFQNWQYESQISQSIYQSSQEEEHLSFGYDGILKFYDIIYHSFLDSYEIIADNHTSVISGLLWKHCGKYLNIYL